MPHYYLSAHAKERWAQRCPGVELQTEANQATRAGKKLINILRESWERSQGKATWCAEHDYLVGPSGTLLIVNGFKVVTVLLVADVKKRAAQRAADDRARRRRVL